MPVASPTIEILRAPAERMRGVAEIAARHSGEVDREGRFPQEAVDALKAERLLGVMVPKRFGGEGLSLIETAELCTILGQACGSTAMIYAMHQIKASSLVSHGGSSPWHADFMRELVEQQHLLASATTEGGIGGDLRNSICAVNVADGRFTLEKDATVISYGLYADAILVTCRRSPDAQSSDQSMVVVKRGDYTLDKTTGWDTLGMRGTCSEGFRLVSAGDAAQIFPQPFSEIAAQSMLSASHILWGAVWFGIAADAVARAQAYVRAAARKQPGSLPPGALRLAEVVAMLQDMKASVIAGVVRYEAAMSRPDELSSMGFAAEMNNLKVTTSQRAAQIVTHAMLITGLSGYKNDTPFSVGRHLRDVTSAAIMISNDRILSNTSNLLLVSRFDTSLVN
ncbi:acyl-CoA/acyl-ACP dehydrogenase [Mesorhizobium sp. BR1-1-16]|uniref:acyl-CoA dehydrogenase family protein n=1 Tax=Mesorhizobium sp. BR1-1-16 TaxID=2876653 RepID=UPI001CCCA28D|nr:acyl-CoA dehydrogenase family protein [Mesorhizobium sp. BR1-1-16]MBZ9936161.1 acyl-CoA/acyl-ACP dehydrogenase [Mesorhizobium sp. BR1-1-16]